MLMEVAVKPMQVSAYPDDAQLVKVLNSEMSATSHSDAKKLAVGLTAYNEYKSKVMPAFPSSPCLASAKTAEQTCLRLHATAPHAWRNGGLLLAVSL